MKAPDAAPIGAKLYYWYNVALRCWTVWKAFGSRVECFCMKLIVCKWVSIIMLPITLSIISPIRNKKHKLKEHISVFHLQVCNSWSRLRDISTKSYKFYWNLGHFPSFWLSHINNHCSWNHRSSGVYCHSPSDHPHTLTCPGLSLGPWVVTGRKLWFIQHCCN